MEHDRVHRRDPHAGQGGGRTGPEDGLRELAACPRCRELVARWWQAGTADDRPGMRRAELDLYLHLGGPTGAVELPALPRCADCAESLTMSRFAMAATDIRVDGQWIDPAGLHRVHHLLERTADVPLPRTGTLTSGFSTVVRLYHRHAGPPGGAHSCTPDRGHEYLIDIRLTSAADRLDDRQAAAFRTAAAEVERDLPHRELEQVLAEHGIGRTHDLADLARLVHRIVAARIGGAHGLAVTVDAPAAGHGPARTHPYSAS